MAFWSHLREMAGGSRPRILRALTEAHRDELRLGRQLRLHAESVPYAAYGTQLRELADRADARAARVAEEITRLRAAIRNGDGRPPRGGRNYWQRLTADLEDLRALAQRYRELGQHFDIEYPATAALFLQLAHEAASMIQVITALIARSDPHAAD